VKLFCGGMLIALMVNLGALPVLADEVSAQPAPSPVADPALVAIHYRQIVSRPEFQEDAALDANSQLKEKLSQWFTRLGMKFGDFKYANQMPIFTSLLMSFLVLLVVIGLLYVIVRLTRRSGERDLEPARGKSQPRTFLPPESYDREIHEALGARDWHRAWLASWRQFLSRLENRHLVEADRTRTNREYLVQLQSQSLPAPTLGLLTEMVDAYDRFIYGRKTIGEPDWSLFHRQIDEAALMLHLDDKHRAPPVERRTA
jgi:hypothetical protein